MKVLLLGGNGFLGKNIQEELSRRQISFVSRDIDDYDMSEKASISCIIDDLIQSTHIVVLASKIGAKLFETDAEAAGKYNDMLTDNFIDALIKAALLYHMSWNVTYYSTSEVFWSQQSADSVIDHNSRFNIDMSNLRSLYSFVKIKAELVLKSLSNSHFAVNALKVIYPFNIVGKHQKRGVAYDMIKDLVTTGKISYAYDTVRTMTSARIASKMACDAILCEKDLRQLQADNRCTVSMKMLAEVVQHVIKMPCEFVELPADKTIRYKQVSRFEDNIDHMVDVADILRDDILDIEEQIER